jgi:glutamyl-Q tRNA(Asp) synthetase
VIGRFAPSPTGPLHRGSLLAALGSYLFAKHHNGAWLVRMEDLDTPRVVRGSADAILRALDASGLHWDGEVVFQSQRKPLYDEALQQLRKGGHVFDCSCSRADLLRAGSAPATSDPTDGEARVYPGTCRLGLTAGQVRRATRFRAPDEEIGFDDLVAGRWGENVATRTGDFVVLRSDGIYAYQLAVVVDDAAQGVTQVIRGGDLLTSTARQIALQRALGYETPSYGHLPLLLSPDGAKLGKRESSPELEMLNSDRISSTLRHTLRLLGQDDEISGSPAEIVAQAVRRFDPSRIPSRPIILS